MLQLEAGGTGGELVFSALLLSTAATNEAITARPKPMKTGSK